MSISGRSWVRAALAMFAVGWGANQFSSLLLAYRGHQGLSASVADALFGAYALGLIPALLIGGPLSDRVGRRTLARGAVVLSVLATLVLVLGTQSTVWLYLGRLLAGVASGAVFAPGTAWVKELSSPPYVRPVPTSAPAGSPAGSVGLAGSAAGSAGLAGSAAGSRVPAGSPVVPAGSAAASSMSAGSSAAGSDAGARRAAIALSAGFGLGPLVAGLISQYAPHPLVTPYVAHLVVVIVAGVVVWRAPETVTAPTGRVWSRILVRSAASPRFRGVVAPLAPWVFTAASVSIAIGPALVTAHTGSHQVAFAGVLAGLTLGTGVLVQPLARRLDSAGSAAGDVRTMAVGLGACLLGCGLETLTAITAQPLLAVLAGLLLGAGYGFCLVAGLLETQRIAAPGELAALTAVYYAVTYVGFAVPLGLSELVPYASYRVLLPGMAGLALLTLVTVLINARRTVT